MKQEVFPRLHFHLLFPEELIYFLHDLQQFRELTFHVGTNSRLLPSNCCSLDFKLPADRFRKVPFNQYQTGHPHIFMSGVRNTGWRLSGFVWYRPGSKVLRLLCGSEPCVWGIPRSSPKPAWKWWIGVLHAIKSLPKFSVAAAAHITGGARLCKDWVKSQFVINGTKARDGCARAAGLRRDESFQARQRATMAGWGSEDEEVAGSRPAFRCIPQRSHADAHGVLAHRSLRAGCDHPAALSTGWNYDSIR